MPRTKVRRAVNNKNENKEDNKDNMVISIIQSQFNSHINIILMTSNSILDKIDTHFQDIKIRYKDSLDKTIEELQEPFQHILPEKLNSILKSKNNTATSDEGYLTTESTGSDLKLSHVTFSTTANSTTGNISSTFSFKTPAPNSILTKQAAMAMGFVTPKVKPNRPLTVLRRANCGEMVISMAGSPVLVNSVDVEKPNVNVPLADGRIISVQPQNSIRMSEIPEIDEDTRKHLQTLRDNIDKIVKKNLK